MTSDIYDSDDAMNRSPLLEPQKINYGLDADRPPFASNEAECTKGTDNRSRKLHQTDTPMQTRYGDGVLMRFMAPDLPEVALHAEQHPLELSPRQSQKEEKVRPKDHPPVKFESKPPLLPTITTSPKRDRVKVEDPKSPPQPIHPPTSLPPPLPFQDSKPSFSSPRRPRLLSLTAPSPPSISFGSLGSDHRRASTSEGFSPQDLKSNAELRSQLSLPSLQSLQSPPSSVGGPSPGACHTQTLPSLKSTLGPEFTSRINGFSPASYSSYPLSASSRNDSPHDRQLPSILPQHIPPSPFSHFSPLSTKDISNNPSPASQPSFWHTPTSAVSTVPSLPPPGPPSKSLPPPPPPPSSDTHQPATPYETSPLTAKSPTASYPTPTEPVAPTAGGERSSFSSHPSPNGGSISGIGTYKCTHAGCTAAPFQTQYLLNSHANVHSQDRPHFCPVEGCARGLGGKGFKRKNEMMRHGLVHNSPGYVCPFCPDQQHRYPRPDNLQRYVNEQQFETQIQAGIGRIIWLIFGDCFSRHVRVHHVDKSKDDPILRQVLAQRPVGSTRGRRRRLNG
ncbi:hypothetical protein N7540_001615 [Penicillium herquei]|nr:hypothetical protein N7540_001615 [Penicillium herquei]